MGKDFERYKKALLEWRFKNFHVLDYIMERASQDGDLTLEEYLELCRIAEGED